MIVLGGPELRVSAQVDVNPPELFRAPPQSNWLIAHCKPRQEKLLCNELAWNGIPRGMFMERRLRRYPGHGVRETLVPLLGGYVFCIGDWDTREMLYRTERVVRIIIPHNPVQLAQELQMLARLIELSEGPLEVNPEIVAGSLVTITRGTLAGMIGVVVRRKGISQLVVNLSVLGTSVAVELPAETAVSLDA
jgi:transcription antitermination factor NusG